MAYEGSFYDENDVEHTFEPIQWRPRDSDDWINSGEDIDLQKAKEIIVEIINQDTGEKIFETIVGEWEDWDAITDILEYDFGQEGSR